MDIKNLPDKKYYLKKVEYKTLVSITGLVTLMFITGYFIFSLLVSAAFIPLLHIPMLLIMLLLAILAYYVKVPPPYVKIDDGKVKVRRTLIGGWSTIDLTNLETAAVRGNSLFLVSLTSKPIEIEIKLNLISSEDAKDLVDLLT